MNLAILVGVSQIYISQYETGGIFPSEKHIKKITEILGIGPEDLNKELHQFYEDRKRELEEKIAGKANNAI